MTIRGKLFAAIALTVLGPLATVAVALSAFGSLGDSFDETQRRTARQELALDLKFAVTDLNGWQTAYGYDRGRSRERFLAAARTTETLVALARGGLSGPREQALVAEIDAAFARFMELDEDAWRALQGGREGQTRRILLGPEIRNFETMARAAGSLADEQSARAAAAAAAFDDARATARRELVAVAIGAGVVIVLLLVTAQDVVRLALERRPG